MAIDHLSDRGRKVMTLIIAAATLTMAWLTVPAASAQSSDDGSAPQWMSHSRRASGATPSVSSRSNSYPVYGSWKYTSTVNNKTYFIPAIEFCVFDAANDEKLGCTYTNNRSSTSEKSRVMVPRLGSFYVSYNGKVKLRDNPITIPFPDPWTGQLQFWNSVTANGVTCFGRTPTYLGTPANENVRGTSRTDVYYMGNGDDIFRGLGGNDLACGGNGKDTMIGGDGVDRLSGDAGQDVLRGDAGNDILIGGRSRDVLIGGAGTDSCRGNNDVKRSCE